MALAARDIDALENRVIALEGRIDTRFASMEVQMGQRFDAFEDRVTEVLSTQATRTDQRLGRLTTLAFGILSGVTVAAITALIAVVGR